MTDLFDYSSSLLNPALKILVFCIFLAATIVYFDVRRRFGGRTSTAIGLLLLFSLFMAAGALLRYFGHGTEFGFTSDYSLKWFQSLAYILAAICSVLAGKEFLTLFHQERK